MALSMEFKIRMIFLFRSGSLREKARLVLKATRQHARNLATFAVVYKSSMLGLRYLGQGGKEGQYDSFFAGLLGGYVVFGRSRSSVTQQIVIYVFARVVLALARLSIEPNPNPLAAFLSPSSRNKVKAHAWPAFASLSWAFVMYLFRWHPEAIQSSLRSSMTYIDIVAPQQIMLDIRAATFAAMFDSLTGNLGPFLILSLTLVFDYNRSL
ncbi:conserved hypothetical protein [Uncinocarpus reesii 1704]|uniref:Peroxisomal membrane protein 4 n=1 Tax=Uncinocarpus reesii (strain UAMH 1704) TaxID=336963 RepID=C4JIJ6_UNCRE|nr:uncharacterized protein UREG_01533 [Uncinocarpus reesii 1704]EEP76684.1 conserved hypothetical protein [Uncinocarpus reesii 1704]